VSGYSEILIY